MISRKYKKTPGAAAADDLDHRHHRGGGNGGRSHTICLSVLAAIVGFTGAIMVGFALSPTASSTATDQKPVVIEDHVAVTLGEEETGHAFPPVTGIQVTD